MQTLMMMAAGLVALGIVVFAHELGHFLVAKAAGIRVLKFSLGFGRKLVGFKWGETEYVISVLPLGGYVRMAGTDALDKQVGEAQEGDYFSRPWWVRILVLFAGPAANLVTAVLVLGLLYFIGFQAPLAKPQVMQVEAGSPAQAAGLAAGDILTALNGEAVDNWETFSDRLNALDQENQPVRLTYLRHGQEASLELTPQRDEKTGRLRLGVTIGAAGSNLIDRVYVGTPAEMAGFKEKDRVLAVEGQPVWSKYDFQQAVWPRPGQPTRFTVERGQTRLELTCTPIAQQLPGEGKVGVIGVNFVFSDRTQLVRYPFFQAFGLGATQTLGITRMILSSLWQMVTGQISARDSLGGPISIMRMAGQEARTGAKDFLFFLAGISIMLGIINLLPIPVMDGGNSVFFLLEGIRRKPLSLRVQEVSQQIGLALLVALMVFATYNDIYKLVAPALGGTP
ncbi:MAG: RIP metalloprotease RseP [candidate division FCPU426 bacterium]